MTKMGQKAKRQPVVVVLLVRLVVGLASRFGLELSADEVLMVLAGLEPALTLILHKSVTPATPKAGA